MKSVSVGQRVWVDLRALSDLEGLELGEIRAWGVGKVSGFGDGDRVGVELESANGARRPVRAPWSAIVVRPVPFR